MKFNRIFLFILVGIICLVMFFILGKVSLTSGDSTKETEIINIFNNNREKFFIVQKYAETLEQNLYVDINAKDLNINEQNINKEIVYIIKELHFVGIYEDKANNTISFVIRSGEREEGIMYRKSNIVPNVSSAIGSCKRIIDNWFYYSENHV